MQLEAAFRRSLYLSLAIASLALCVAEGEFLPEIPIIGGLVGSLLLIAYFLEGRWSLNLSSANTVGMVLTAILGIWIAYQFFRPQSESLIYQLPWPTSLLPYLGPVLLILIPVKLCRPKEIGDYWAMYGLGLMSMALGCTMALEGLFGLLLVLWLIVFIWSLTLFYLYRESGLQPLLSMGARSEAAQYSGRFPLLKRAGRWTLSVLAVGFICFTITPRISSNRWDRTLRPGMETGINSESQIDLNRTGNLNVNEELAFTVLAEDAQGNPKIDLEEGARWRYLSMCNYVEGRWDKTRYGGNLNLHDVCRTIIPDLPNPSRDPATSSPRNARLPLLGPGQYTMTIQPAPEQSPIPLLMDPPFWKPQELPPVVTLQQRNPEIWKNWQHAPDTTFRPMTGSRTSPIWRETRVDPREPNLGPTMYLINNGIPKAFFDYAAAPNLLAWTDRLIERLIVEGSLPPEIRQRDGSGGRRNREYHELIARTLCTYLATSPEFEYTLDLKRKDRRLDPVEDFLYNTKAGHCQRFATALVLMLRTQGIPSQFVLGYKGCEQVAAGSYAIRQSNAHAWVEVLIPRPPHPDDPPEPPADPNGKSPPVIRYHWLDLDPTPDQSSVVSESTAANWFDAAQNKTAAFFRNIILGFNNDLREKAGQYVASFFLRAGDSVLNAELSHELVVLSLLIGLPIAVFFLRRSRRRRRVPVSDSAEAKELAKIAPFHVRLMSILNEAGYRPQPSQTAKEFAAIVENGLSQKPHTQSVATVPRDAADCYYRVRFGQEALSPNELSQLGAALDRLETSIRSTLTERKS